MLLVAVIAVAFTSSPLSAFVALFVIDDSISGSGNVQGENESVMIRIGEMMMMMMIN